MTHYGMIDWFRGSVTFLHHPLPAGRVLSIKVDGSVEWEAVKSIPIRSSHETSIKIKSAGRNGEGMATEIMIDGNLSKFPQGHNILGPVSITVPDPSPCLLSATITPA
jgi:II/X family phage/plasmid replication protein